MLLTTNNGRIISEEEIAEARKAAKLFPREIRERVADRDFIPRKTPDRHYQSYLCANGLCVVAALITETGGNKDNTPLFGTGTAIHEMSLLGLVDADLPDQGLYSDLYQETSQNLYVLMKLNDDGVLRTPEAVRYVLLDKEEN